MQALHGAALGRHERPAPSPHQTWQRDTKENEMFQLGPTRVVPGWRADGINHEGRWIPEMASNAWSSWTTDPAEAATMIRGAEKELAEAEQRADRRNGVLTVTMQRTFVLSRGMAEIEVAHLLDEEQNVSPEWHVLVTGNPIDGIHLNGPFPSFQDAADHADACALSEWWVTPIKEVEG